MASRNFPAAKPHFFPPGGLPAANSAARGSILIYEIRGDERTTTLDEPKTIIQIYYDAQTESSRSSNSYDEAGRFTEATTKSRKSSNCENIPNSFITKKGK